jgi:hypothetical protein
VHRNGEEGKRSTTLSEDEIESHEKDEDKDNQSLNADSQLDVDGAPEDDDEEDEDHMQNHKSSPSTRDRFMCGCPFLNAVENPYHLSLKNINKATTDNVEITTVLLNDFCEALLKGFPIDHVPAYSTKMSLHALGGARARAKAL